MKKHVYVLGGGTFTYVRNHLSLSAPAFGETAINIYKNLNESWELHSELSNSFDLNLVLTKMADPRGSMLATNDDVLKYVDKLIDDPCTAAIIFNVALADFFGTIDGVESGKYAERLRTKNGITTMQLIPTDKVIGRIKPARPDIVVVGFKTTANESPAVQYERGLNLVINNSLDFAIANDTVTRNNMFICPDDAILDGTDTADRNMCLSRLSNEVLRRIQKLS